MKQSFLIVVDMQNDFVTGSLGTKEAEAIVPAVCRKVEAFPGPVLYTMDTHEENYLSTQEGRMLPVSHCIRGKDGWQLIPELSPFLSDATLIFEKPTFGSRKLAEYLKEREKEIATIELVGLCTDICVISNALLLKAYMPEIPIAVDSSCCAGVTPEAHNAAIATMRSCQILVES